MAVAVVVQILAAALVVVWAPFTVSAKPNLALHRGKKLYSIDFSAAPPGTRSAFQALKNDDVDLDVDVWDESRGSATFVSTEAGLAAASHLSSASEVVIDDLEAHFASFFASHPVCEQGVSACVGFNASTSRRTVDDCSSACSSSFALSSGATRCSTTEYSMFAFTHAASGAAATETR